MNRDEFVHFVPSCVEGLSGATSVTVFPDRLELVTGETRRRIPFVDIATWPWPTPLWRALARLGLKPGWLHVGERDWFHDPPDRFIVFYTDPPLKIFMPADEPREHHGSTFARIQQVLLSGGFTTHDLG